MHFPIDLKLQLNLGGVQQTIRVWGTDEKMPLVLFLHGGPGIPNRHELAKHRLDLARHFTLAAWDQRGTGGSFSGCDPDTLTPEQLVRDCGKVLDYLCLRYYQTKVILVCSDSGISLGNLVAGKYPHKVAACIVCGDKERVSDTAPGKLPLLLSGEYAPQEISGIQKGHALWKSRWADWPVSLTEWRVPCYPIQTLPETAAEAFSRQFKEIIDKENIV